MTTTETKRQRTRSAARPVMSALGAAALTLSIISPTLANTGGGSGGDIEAQEAADLQICLGGVTTCYFDETAEISEWDVARTGLEVEGSGFEPGAAVEVVLGATSVGTTVADANGEIAEFVTSTAPAGEHTITLKADGEEVSDSFLVVDDAEWFADHLEDPSVTGSDTVVTVAQIASEPITFYATDFPYDTPVDVYLNDAFVETVRHAYHFDYELTGEYTPGEYIVEFRHPVGTASHAFSVVADDQGEIPPPGQYLGSSRQTHAGHGELDPPETGAFTFDVDESGNVHSLTGEFWWVCVAGGVESGYIELAESGFPATPITVDRPFEITWTSGASDYTLTGVVNADGSANGTFVFDHGPCGNSILSWTTELSGELPTPDPDPSFEVDPIAPISQWDIERTGLTVSASGFERDESVTIQIGGQTFTTEADFFGDVSFVFDGAVGVGTHTLTITTAGGSVSATFDVVADEDYFEDHSETPLMFVIPEVVPASQASPIEVIAQGLVEDSNVDVRVNGNVVDSIFAALGSVDYELTEALGVGEHTIELFHPSVSVSATFTVVPDADGDPAPAGTFTGAAEQSIAGTVWSSEVEEFDVTFTVDDAGNISGFASEYRWVCWLSPNNPTGTIDFGGMPETRISADRAFAVSWTPETTTSEVFVYGTVNSDGSASGTIFVDNGSCGFNYLHWSAAGDGEYDPAPVVDPEAEASTDELTAAELADSGIVITGTGFPAGETVSLTVGSTPVATEIADDDGAVTFTFISSNLGAGTYTALLTAGDVSASVEFTVTEDATDPDPDPEPGDGGAEPDPEPGDGGAEPDPEPGDGGAEEGGNDNLDTLPETGINSVGLAVLSALLLLTAGIILRMRATA